MRKPKRMGIDRQVGIVACEHAGRAGMIEMDMRNQQRAQVGRADIETRERLEQVRKGRSRTALDQGVAVGASDEIGGDRPAGDSGNQDRSASSQARFPRLRFRWSRYRTRWLPRLGLLYVVGGRIPQRLVGRVGERLRKNQGAVGVAARIAAGRSVTSRVEARMTTGSVPRLAP